MAAIASSKGDRDHGRLRQKLCCGVYWKVLKKVLNAFKDVENIMNQIKSSGKESARDWLKQRQAKPAPLPDIEQIRRELGWKFLEEQQRKPRC